MSHMPHTCLSSPFQRSFIAVYLLWFASGCSVLDKVDPRPTAATEANVPLTNPIPKAIALGNIKVRAVNFLQVPRTEDVSTALTVVAGINTPLASSRVHARLQYMKPIGDGSRRLVISDLRGQLYLADGAGKSLRTYLDIRKVRPEFGSSVFPNEAGLLGVAFHPDFAKPGTPGFGKFYTGYSATTASGRADFLGGDDRSHHSVLQEWTTEDPSANTFTGTSRKIMRVGQFAPNHNIGTLAFNRASKPGDPDYGKLYICMGDGGAAHDPRENGQDLSSVLGTILRIDPLGGDAERAYGIPADNPFVDQRKAAPEIWAYGLRHPQHFSFDSSGRLFISDIGQDQVEEVNLGVAGGNYGWRIREGTFATAWGLKNANAGPVYAAKSPNPDFIEPIAEYDHDEGNAISSGYVYEGNDIPALRGHYVFADLVRGRIFYFDLNDLKSGAAANIYELQVRLADATGDDTGPTNDLITVAGHENTYAPDNLRADLRLGIDSKGELYLLTKGDGWIRKLQDAN